MNDSQEKFFTKVAAIAANFASPARLKIIYILAQAPRSVETIAQITGESVANTSQHLQRLAREGLVLVKKDKVSRIYRLASDTVALLIEHLLDLTEEYHFNSLTAKEKDTLISLDEVLPKLKAPNAYLLDVREEYEAHNSPVTGALAIPLANLAGQLATLPPGATFYLFCRGRACETANQGVTLLRSSGIKAFCLKESPTLINERINNLITSVEE